MNQNIIKCDYDRQMDAINTINLFSNKSRCMHAYILENLLRRINSERNNKDLIKKYQEMINDFVVSNYCKQEKANPEKWMTFFQLFKIPYSIENFSIKSFNFREGFFDGIATLRYSFIIEDKTQDGQSLCKYLERLGYKKFGSTSISRIEENADITGIKFGNTLNINYAFSSEEQLFFLFKYLIFYNLFSFWANVCNFQLNNKHKSGKNIWYLRDKKLPEKFKKILESFFLIKGDSYPEEFIFRYRINELSKPVIDFLFNKYLFADVKEIEKKTTFYVLTKYGQFDGNKVEI